MRQRVAVVQTLPQSNVRQHIDPPATSGVARNVNWWKGALLPCPLPLSPPLTLLTRVRGYNPQFFF